MRSHAQHARAGLALLAVLASLACSTSNAPASCPPCQPPAACQSLCVNGSTPPSPVPACVTFTDAGSFGPDGGAVEICTSF